MALEIRPSQRVSNTRQLILILFYLDYTRVCLRHLCCPSSVSLFCFTFESEDAKGVSRIRISKKNRQHNGQKVKKDKQQVCQNFGHCFFLNLT
jgi:hypothetical protein